MVKQGGASDSIVAGMRGGWTHHLTWLPIPISLATIAALRWADSRAVWNPPGLLAVLNTTFLALTSFLVSFLAARSYLATPSEPLLLLGCGTLAIGLGGGLAGQPVLVGPGQNAIVSVYNTMACLAGVCHLASALAGLRPRVRSPRFGWLLLLASYLAVAGLAAALLILVRGELLPLYFVEGSGATAFGHVVLAAAAVFFAASALFLGSSRDKRDSPFYRRYVLGLGLIAVGLVGVSLQSEIGDPLNWAGRTSQYVGGIYMLIAAVVAIRQSGVWMLPQEKTLREVRERYRLLVEMSPDAILVHAGGKYVFANPAAAALLAAGSPGEVVGREVMALVHPDDREIVARRIERAYGGETTPVRDLRFLRLDGRPVDVEVSGTRVEFDGQPAVQLIVRDITERRRAENALQESEARLRAVLENSRSIAFNRNLLMNTYNYFSPVVYTLTGYTAEEIMSMGPEQTIAMIHPDDRDMYVACTRALIASSEPSPYDVVEYRWLTRSDGYRWYSVNRRLVRDGEGRPTALVGTIRDIHEQKLVAERLRFSEERFRMVLMDSPIRVSTMDADLRYTWVYNPAIQVGLDDLIGKRAEEVMSGEGMEEVTALRREVLARGVAGHREVREAYPDGPRWFDMTVEPLRDAAGQVSGVANVVFEITERVRAEVALREANERLEAHVVERTAELEQRTEQLRQLAAQLTLAEERERRRVAQVLHDELQQVLVAARFNLYQVQLRSAGERAAEAVRQADDLLSGAIRISRSLTTELSPAVLYELGLAPALVWLGQWMGDNHGLAVEVAADPQSAPEEEDLRILLFQCARESLLNVAKHAGVRAARLSLSLAEGGMAEVAVSDEGAGFDPARVLADRQLEGGLGLFSMRERLVFLGGEMEVDSAPGRGTRIRVRVPLHRASAAAGVVGAAGGTPAAVEPPSGEAQQRRIRVLVVDDHAVVRQGLVSLLAAEADIEVLGEAGDGIEAAEMARRLRPDAVTMDVSMPRMGGIEATRHILAEMPGVRVVGLTMYADPVLEDLILQAGAVACLQKGGEIELVLAAIRAPRSAASPVGPEPASGGAG